MKDRILNSMLEETLGGVQPPDLSQRILQQREQGVPEPTAPPVQSGPMPVVRQVDVATPSRRSRLWLTISVTAALLLVVVGGWWWQQQATVPSLANDSTTTDSDANEAVDDGQDGPLNSVEDDVESPKRIRDRVKPRQPRQVANADRQPGGASLKQQSPPSDTGSTDLAVQQRRRTIEPVPDAEVIARVDDAIAERLADLKLASSPLADDATWCRRVFLRLIGRIPDVEELQAFVQDEAKDKRARLVDTLLSSRYESEYTEHWAGYWASVLVGRRGGESPNAVASREGLLEYLRESITSAKPFDRMAYELISAEGSARPEDDDFNGAVNFLLANYDPKGLQATARTTRVFLGQKLQCVQCHNHPTNDWKQHEFWQMNAFFRSMKSEKDRRSGVIRLVNRHFAGEGKDARDGEVYFERPDGQMRIAYPVLPDGRRADKINDLAAADRRALLANYVANSDELSQAVANRIWSHFLGFGLTHPVDDMGDHNPASHQDVLSVLSEQLVAQQYDLKRLMRWIVLSDPFQRSSEVLAENAIDAPHEGAMAHYSRYYTRQMEPEEVYQSLMLVARARNKAAGTPLEMAQARQVWMGSIARRMGTDDNEEIHVFDGGIGQSLQMMNGPLMRRATSFESGSLLEEVTKSKLDHRAKIEHLFLAAVSRKPSKREMEVSLKMVREQKQQPELALQDIWWALLNSNEFILDH